MPVKDLAGGPDDIIEVTVTRGVVHHGAAPAVRDLDNPDPKLRDRILKPRNPGRVAFPNEKVKMTRREAEQLRALGRIAAVDGTAPVPGGIGPVYSQEDGKPSIKTVG